MSETGLGEHPPPGSLKFFYRIAVAEGQMKNRNIKIGFQFREKSREQWLIRYLMKKEQELICVNDLSQAQIILRQKEEKTEFELIRNQGEEILCCLADRFTVSGLLNEIRQKVQSEDINEPPVLMTPSEKELSLNPKRQEALSGEKERERYPGLCCVFSPAGGCGKTTFSLAYAQEMARRGNGLKVLYWSLQRAEDWSLYFRSTTNYNLSDILYSLLSEDSVQLEEVLEKAAELQENGVYLIRPCNDIRDLSNLEEKDLERLLGLLTRVFSVIICDMNSCFDEFNARFMKKSGKLLYLINDLSMVRIKWENFLEQLNRNQMKEEYMKNASLVCICEKKGDEKSMVRGFPGQVYYLPWTSRLCKEQKGILTIRQDSNYYEYIRKVD